ncbi:MAG: hypothetical protein HRU00_04230 [Myxococcales bacterium]|nr:hypothetical protein [Myxococcales bacterium]
MAAFANQDPTEEQLKALQEGINRLRIEYDQYFLGTAKREPRTLRSQIERLIAELMNELPRNVAQKFRLHSLVARFNSLRTRWGRTLREIEAGTYQRHRFKAQLHRRPPEATSAARPALAPGPARASAADQIFEAYCCARTKTGEGAAGISRESLNGLLKKQTATLHKQHPDARISFRVVVEGNRAKIKASVGRT